MHELLGTKEVGELLGWHRAKVHVYYTRGKLPEPHALLGGKRPVWTTEQIEKWMQKSEAEPEAKEQVNPKKGKPPSFISRLKSIILG